MILRDCERILSQVGNSALRNEQQLSTVCELAVLPGTLSCLADLLSDFSLESSSPKEQDDPMDEELRVFHGKVLDWSC